MSAKKKKDPYEGYADRIVKKAYVNACTAADKLRATGDPASISRADAQMRSWDSVMARLEQPLLIDAEDHLPTETHP